MINFCLMVILLSAFRKIMYLIDAELMQAIDDKLETALYYAIGAVMLLLEVVKPTKTELALYQKQKEIAIENAYILFNKLKAVFCSVYNTYIDVRNSTIQYNENQNLKLLTVVTAKEEYDEAEFNEGNSNVA